ncbi:MOSC domain-containing protein [Devosia sp. FKR38]|uniref:MOSC domain-containing protein n=1 Tax=Devosia sp. FKR38 TaxID=2562312 RepID=UPI0010C07C7E|nr:MOSC domain-containing protein [Devosia sp. FKR38]
MNGVRLGGLLTGSVRPLGAKGAPSGIDKQPVSGPVVLTHHGLTGDAQGDLRVHGGPDKALHHYPFDHYAQWAEALGALPLLSRSGAFGENLSTLGLTEADVAVGDVFALGSAIIEVSQGRQPCWKLNARFEVADMARRVQISGRTGWYYRVLQTGQIAPDDALYRIDRRAPEWSIGRIWQIFYLDPLNRDVLAELAELAPLAEGWRRHARRRLDTGTVEDWSRRLSGDAAG